MIETRIARGAARHERQAPEDLQLRIVKKMTICSRAVALCLLLTPGVTLAASEEPWTELFAAGEPAGWIVTEWSDLRKPGPPKARWRVEGGVLYGSAPRGTWLVSPDEYGDFELSFDWKLGARGNSGVALRAPTRRSTAWNCRWSIRAISRRATIPSRAS